jgi:hypothetical protein
MLLEVTLITLSITALMPITLDESIEHSLPAGGVGVPGESVACEPSAVKYDSFGAAGVGISSGAVLTKDT